MLGYETIQAVAPNSMMIGFTVAFSLFSIRLVLQLYHGMGCGWGDDWNQPTDYNNVCVQSWVRTLDGWELQESRGTYRDYVHNDRYEWKWIPGERDMGFVMKDPPAECRVFMSPDMRKAADEILSKVPKQTYN